MTKREYLYAALFILSVASVLTKWAVLGSLAVLLWAFHRERAWQQE